LVRLREARSDTDGQWQAEFVGEGWRRSGHAADGDGAGAWVEPDGVPKQVAQAQFGGWDET